MALLDVSFEAQIHSTLNIHGEGRWGGSSNSQKILSRATSTFAFLKISLTQKPAAADNFFGPKAGCSEPEDEPDFHHIARTCQIH